VVQTEGFLSLARTLSSLSSRALMSLAPSPNDRRRDVTPRSSSSKSRHKTRWPAWTTSTVASCAAHDLQDSLSHGTNGSGLGTAIAVGARKGIVQIDRVPAWWLPALVIVTMHQRAAYEAQRLEGAPAHRIDLDPLAERTQEKESPFNSSHRGQSARQHPAPRYSAGSPLTYARPSTKGCAVSSAALAQASRPVAGV
jgi:hypothetical protein